jgi:hypothetical protein
MSAANAAAIKRRANVSISSSPQVQQRGPENMNNNNSPQQNTPPNGAGLTIHQVIGVIDGRLLYLEKAILVKSETKPDESVPAAMVEHIEDFNNRFELLAMEIDSIKTILMNLQSYTMDVNRRLLDDKTTVLPIEESDSNLASMTMDNFDLPERIIQ